MSRLTIYGDSISGNCLKVKWVADLMGRSYDWIETDITKGESRTPQFLALNPWGQVPTAVLEDGRPLAQSNAIMLHLAEGSNLIPTDPFDRAKMFEWLFWEQYSHEPTVAVVRFRVRYQGIPIDEVDPGLVKKALSVLQRLEDHLDGRAFLVGDALTLADIALVAYSRLAPEGGMDLAPFPRLRTWIKRVEQRLGL